MEYFQSEGKMSTLEFNIQQKIFLKNEHKDKFRKTETEKICSQKTYIKGNIKGISEIISDRR